MTTATKCIAVKTPYGLMYLELAGDEYGIDKDDLNSINAYTKLVQAMGIEGIRAFPFNSEWVVTSSLSNAFLPIVSNYGDQFPQ